MRVIVSAADLDVEQALCSAARAGGFDAEGVRTAPLMCSDLYRDPDSMGVLWSASFHFARMTVEEFRRAGVKNILFVLKSGANENQRIRLIVAGADDVQPAPIDQREYVARLKALARRVREVEAATVALPAGAFLDLNMGVLTGHTGEVTMTKIEADLLAHLAARPDVVLTKEQLLDALYGGRDEPRLKIIDVFICKIRKKVLRATGGLDCIETVWGRGYQFVPGGFRPSFSESRVRMAG